MHAPSNRRGALIAHGFLAALGLSLSALSFAVPTATVEQDTDRPGGDYRSFDTRVRPRQAPQAQEACRAACISDRRCMAYTFYLRPPANARLSSYRTASCWLKKHAAEPAPLKNHVSGRKVYPQPFEREPGPDFVDPPFGTGSCAHFGMTCRAPTELQLIDGQCQCALPRMQVPE